MNTPNPLLPQGSLQPAKSKSNVRLVFFSVVAIHAVFIVGVLIQGCSKPKQEEPAQQTHADLPPLTQPDPSTNAAYLSPTSPLPATATSPSNGLSTLPAAPAATSTVPAVATAPAVPVTPTPAPTEPEAGATKEYVVLKGDNFSTIAKKLHVSAKAIAAANPGVESTKLKVGQKLQVPAGAAAPAASTTAVATAAAPDASADASGETYIVKSGDTLTKIAKAHKVTLAALRSANGLKSDRLTVKQKLKIPAGKSSTEAAPAAASATPAPAPVTTTASIPALPAAPGTNR